MARSLLLVDDDPDDMRALELALVPLKVATARVTSGDEALRRLLEHEFAAVVMDLLMPRLNGFETAAMIRAHRRFSGLPIVILTGYEADGLRSVPGYIPDRIDLLGKPVVPAHLRALVEEILQRTPRPGS